MEIRKMFSDILVIIPKQTLLRDSNLYYSVTSTVCVINPSIKFKDTEIAYKAFKSYSGVNTLPVIKRSHRANTLLKQLL